MAFHISFVCLSLSALPHKRICSLEDLCFFHDEGWDQCHSARLEGVKMLETLGSPRLLQHVLEQVLECEQVKEETVTSMYLFPGSRELALGSH